VSAGSLAVLVTFAVTVAPLPSDKPPPFSPIPPPKHIVPVPRDPAPKGLPARPDPTRPGAPGTVCRDPRLIGQAVPDIVEVDRLACGIDDPVKIGWIGSIELAPPIVTGCMTARRVADWLTGVAEPAAERALGARITGMRVMGSYACRRRNNGATSRRSEHGRGRAVDIGGFTLSTGQVVSVKRDWGKDKPGAFLREIWRKACGPFATVLGPDADPYHHDHFHLDTSPRGGAPYCR